jgi:plasmid stability protein
MTLKIELPEEKTAALAAKARTRGLSAEQYVRQILEHDLESEPAASLGQPLRTAADIILSSMREVPAEDMATLPKDGASQHDYYIYGWPKREP